MSTLSDQYKTIKAKYPDAVLLFRIGDFYKSFGEDAKVLSQITGEKLTPSSDTVLNVMVRFPFHSLDCTLRTLVKRGYKVAICEQLEYPMKAKGTTKRGIRDSFKTKFKKQ